MTEQAHDHTIQSIRLNGRHWTVEGNKDTRRKLTQNEQTTDTDRGRQASVTHCATGQCLHSLTYTAYTSRYNRPLGIFKFSLYLDGLPATLTRISS